MTTEEQAKKYGVPTPEMCKLLAPYLEETTFMWCRIGDAGYSPELGNDTYKRGDYVLCLSSLLPVGNTYYLTPELITAFEEGDNEEDIPAPQIHELLELIQKDCDDTIWVKYTSENVLADFLADFYFKIKQEGICPAPTITHPK